jgi:hypothetical protein
VGAQQVARGEGGAEHPLPLPLLDERGHALAAPQQVVLAQLQPAQPHLAALHLRLQAGGPLVARLHHHVHGAVRLAHGEDVRVGDVRGAAQDALRVQQERLVVAVAFPEEELAPDHLVARADVGAVRQAERPPEARARLPRLRVEDGAVVDEHLRDPPARALVHGGVLRARRARKQRPRHQGERAESSG